MLIIYSAVHAIKYSVIYFVLSFFIDNKEVLKHMIYLNILLNVKNTFSIL